MLALLSSRLPSLQRLAVTPYGDLPHPTSLVPKFVQVHGSTLRSLHFYTPKDTQSTIFHPSPSDILLMCPLTRVPLLELKIPSYSNTSEAHPTLYTVTQPVLLPSSERYCTLAQEPLHCVYA